MRKPLLATFATALLLGGCVGSILGGDSDDGGGGPEPIPPDEPREVCASGQADQPGPRLLRRLTLPEFTASVQAGLTLRDAEWKSGFLPPDPAGKNGFTNNVDRLRVSEGYARDLYDTARGIADVVTSDAVARRILPCSATGGEACAKTFLDTFGKRLFRRPLTEAEQARYLALFQKVADDGALFTDWMYWATVGLVQSPSFLYRSELGEGSGGAYTLTPFEIATALAYNLTGKPPSDALLEQAATGGLADAAAVESAARALVVDEQNRVRDDFRAVFLQFTSQWLGISSLGNLVKSPTAFPGYTDDVRTSMIREVDNFVAHVVFEERGGIADLLTSPVTFIDRNLAAFYGFGTAGDQAAPAERPPGWGIGVLSQGAVLSVYAGNEHTSPVRRGVMVQKKFLCFEPPPPPAVVGDLPVPTGNETTRQRYELHSTNEVCRGCHQYMDPVGFAFEHLDAAGRFRADENGLAIDDTGVLKVGDDDVAFTGPTELATTLAQRPETAECVASYVASFAYGLDNHDTSCLVSSLTEDFRSKDLGFVDLYIGLARTNYFTHRVD